MPPGIVECWPPARRAYVSESLRLGENTGYEKRKKVYSTKNVVSTFYDDACQTSIFCFCPRRYVIITRNQYNYIRFDSLNPTFHQSKTHDSAKKLHCVPNIPEFQQSNWAKPLRSQFSFTGLLPENPGSLLDGPP